MAHTASAALHFGIDQGKLADIRDYQPSARLSTLRRRQARSPNAVTDDIFAKLAEHWTEEQFVEIIGTIAATGLVNSWNSTMVTPLEDEPMTIGLRHLAGQCWKPARHA